MVGVKSQMQSSEIMHRELNKLVNFRFNFPVKVELCGHRSLVNSTVIWLSILSFELVNF